MNRSQTTVILFFLFVILSLVFSVVQSNLDLPGVTSTPWLAPEILPETVLPTPEAGWWKDLPTPIPLPSPTIKH